MGRPIRLIIVDDHEMVRMGLRSYLEMDDDIEILGEGSNGIEAIELAKSYKPDVILMDLLMEEMNGIEATREIMRVKNEINPNIRIIVLTSFIEEDKIFPAIEAGAFSFMLKTSSADKILDAVKKAYAGEQVVEGQITSIMLKKVSQRAPKHHELTSRELEVLKLIGQGKTNKEISEELYIGIKTVKTHVSNILAKLEVEDRTKAAVYANQNNIL